MDKRMDFDLVDESVSARFDLIRPSAITSDVETYLSTFGSAEVEEAARQLVEFFQQLDLWHKFTYAELIAFYERKGWDINGMLYGLTGPHLHCDGMFDHECWRRDEPLVVHVHQHHFEVTEHFINRCSQNVRNMTSA